MTAVPAGTDLLHSGACTAPEVPFLSTSPVTRTRVKICGITRIEDARAAIAAGADALGFVFHPDSPRAVSALQVAEIICQLPPFVTTVGLFVDADPSLIDDVLAVAPLDLLQFHGDETPADCARHGRPWIKALRMHPELDLVATLAGWRAARAVLLDAWHPQLAGGTGLTFDWHRLAVLAGCQDLPAIILAGGLNPDNVAEAIRLTHPFAVDVSGGVEAGKGIKDARKIDAFMAGVASA